MEAALVLVVCGVSGAGKTTVGRLLALQPCRGRLDGTIQVAAAFSNGRGTNGHASPVERY